MLLFDSLCMTGASPASIYVSTLGPSRGSARLCCVATSFLDCGSLLGWYGPFFHGPDLSDVDPNLREPNLSREYQVEWECDMDCVRGV